METNKRDYFSSISKAWQLVSSDFTSYILAGLVMLIPLIIAIIISTIITFILGFLGPLAILGIPLSFLTSVIIFPFLYGLSNFSLKAVHGQKPELGDIFSYLTQDIINVLVIGAIFTIIGSFTFGAFAGLLPIAYFYMLEKKLSIGDTLNKMKDFIMQDPIMVLIYGFVLAVINTIAASVCVLPVLLTIPLTFVAAAYVYKDYLSDNNYTSNNDENQGFEDMQNPNENNIDPNQTAKLPDLPLE